MAKYNGKKVASVVKTIPVAVEIEANPSEQATEELEKIKVGDKVYDNPPFVEGIDDDTDDKNLKELRIKKGNTTKVFRVKTPIEVIELNEDFWDEENDRYYLSYDGSSENNVIVAYSLTKNSYYIEVEPPYPCYGVVAPEDHSLIATVNKRQNERGVVSFVLDIRGQYQQNVIIDFTGGFAKVYLADTEI